MNQHDAQAEAHVLSAVLSDNAALDEVADMLEPEDFFTVPHRELFSAMRRVWSRGEPIDLVTLRAELTSSQKLQQAGGDEKLLGIHDTYADPARVEEYAQLVRGHAAVRAVVRAALDIVGWSKGPIESAQDFLDRAESALYQVTHDRRDESRTEGMNEIVQTLVQEIVERRTSGEVRGLRTGITRFDQMTSGLRGSQLVIGAGRPGMGKSAWAGHVALRVAEEDQPVLVWSGEMARVEWAERMLVGESLVLGDAVRSGRLSELDWSKISKAANRVSKYPILIDDTPAISLWALRSKARRMRAKHGLSLLVVDYLQLMTSGEHYNSREAEVAAISRGLKAIAKELEIPVLALAQLNRSVESRQDKRPMLADLRESGQIEQDADVITFLYRPHYYDEAQPDTLAELIVAKQRGGATGTVKAYFDPATVRWGNLDLESDPFDYGDAA